MKKYMGSGSGTVVEDSLIYSYNKNEEKRYVTRFIRKKTNGNPVVIISDNQTGQALSFEGEDLLMLRDIVRYIPNAAFREVEYAMMEERSEKKND